MSGPTQNISFLAPALITNLGSDVVSLSGAVASLDTAVASPATFYDQIGPSNVFSTMTYNFKNNSTIEPWDFIKIYENLRNCYTGPLSNISQRVLSDDNPTETTSWLASSTETNPSFKNVKVSSTGVNNPDYKGVDLLATQLLAVSKIVSYSYNMEFSITQGDMQYQYAKQLDVKDIDTTKQRIKEIASTMVSYCDELLDGTLGTLDTTLYQYISLLKTMFNMDVTWCETLASGLDAQYYGSLYGRFWPTYPKWYSFFTGFGYPLICVPNNWMYYYNGLESWPVKLCLESSQNFAGHYYNYLQQIQGSYQKLMDKVAEIPDLGLPPSVWGSFPGDLIYGSSGACISDVIQNLEAVPNGDGMGNTLPTGTYDAFGNIFGSIIASVPAAVNCYSSDFSTYSSDNPLYGLGDSEFIIQNLSNLLSSDEKTKIYNECKYVYENLIYPFQQEVLVPQMEDICFTKGKQFYDKDLWQNKWRYSIPGQVLFVTGPSEGSYDYVVVDMTGCSATTISTLVSAGAETGAVEGVYNIPLSISYIEELADLYRTNLQVLNGVFPGSNYVSTYEVTGTLDYNNYTNSLEILNNYDANVIYMTGVQDIENAFIANGEGSVGFYSDVKYFYANQWIQEEYSQYGSTGLFSGATGLDSYLPALSTIDKFNNIITPLAIQTLSESVLSDLDVLGYNYGYLPSGATGNAGDYAPVYVAPGFTGPTYSEIWAQQDTSDLTKPLDLQINLDMSQPFLFVYRQHYKILYNSSGAELSGTPIDANDTPIDFENLSTESATNNMYATSYRGILFNTSRGTYLGYKQLDFLTQVVSLTWNNAWNNENIFSRDFINEYLLTGASTGVDGTFKHVNFTGIGLFEVDSDSGGFVGYSSQVDPNEPTEKLAFFTEQANKDPYTAGYAMNPIAKIVDLLQFDCFGNIITQIVSFIQETQGTTTTPWITKGVDGGADFNYSITYNPPMYNIISWSWAVYVLVQALGNGYAEVDWNLQTNTVTAGTPNYAAIISGLASASRFAARQICDLKFNLPRFGWSTSKLLNEFKDLTGLQLGGELSEYIGRFITMEVQQTTFNFGLGLNLGAVSALKGILGGSFSQVKYNDIRVLNNWFQNTGWIDYVEENSSLFSN